MIMHFECCVGGLEAKFSMCMSVLVNQVWVC